LTRPYDIFLIGREKIENLIFFRVNFPNLEVADPTQPDLSKKNDTTQLKKISPGPITNSIQAFTFLSLLQYINTNAPFLLHFR